MSTINFQTKILRAPTSPEEYRVYLAGLEYDLSDPIVIENRGDLKSESRWRDRMEPYQHQVSNLITFCRRLPVTLLADDVGLGKTISAGLIISELIARSRLSKILIVCPKVLGPQWQEELLTKFNIPSIIATGKDLVNLEPEDIGAIITTYNSARMHLNSIPKDRFQMLVLDEAHKLRNLYGSAKSPEVAQRFRQALEERRFRFVLMLTATPIHNRLWDLYSLVDLLTVARGHENPFGSEGKFAQKFIADKHDQARQLKPEAKDEFRSIVYGYMSRVRRGDAKLSFPDRVVQMFKVEPSAAELMLIKTLAKPIQDLNKLAQISILQALTSSPQALLAQMKNMAEKGSVPNDLVDKIKDIVSNMPISAKLNGLGSLIDKLKLENPDKWRLVVFTGRIETQTIIQDFLEKKELKVGIINGRSGQNNQETITNFRKNPPEIRVIVSTEAGSEGINLQVANVLVNYDLPWNPMIVEQRIGRVQRLASEHASVAIFNIMLKGTYEEYIVGRLMEKLQMASHSIGDIEALLEASGISGEEENTFDEKIRILVLSALEGKNIEEATRLTEQSILEAKKSLAQEEENINSMIGGSDGNEYVGPRIPTLPGLVHSMTPQDFAIAALKNFGMQVTQKSEGLFLIEEKNKKELIRFEEKITAEEYNTLYAPGSSAFLRLVGKVINTGIYDIIDIDINSAQICDELTRNWVQSFVGITRSVEIENVNRCFEGLALIRVRVTVTHDSYERIVSVNCASIENQVQLGKSGLGPIPATIEKATDVGLNIDKLGEIAKQDKAISEFSRFYLERREQEIKAVVDDERKRKKLEDEFTPRYEMTLVAIEGKIFREVKVKILYSIEGDFEYESSLQIIPNIRKIQNPPEFEKCTRTGKSVPGTCLGKCQISNAIILKHLLVKSEISSRLALPEFTVICELSGKRVINDEVLISDVSGKRVAISLLKTSVLSGKKAEPEHFAGCDFTKSDLLKSELAISEVSGKAYRIDEQMNSSVSGKSGHKQEFIQCFETQQLMTLGEAEKCEVTGKYVIPGRLEVCAVTSKHVLSSELERCAVTGKKVLKNLLVTSNISEARILEKIAVKSITGKFCSPVEVKTCFWSEQKCHPEDILICELTGLPINLKFATANKNPRLQPLVDLLNGIKRNKDEPTLWDEMLSKIELILGKGKSRIESTSLSPNKLHLAVCVEVRSFFGLKVRHAGLIYAINDRAIIGRVTQGKRTAIEWLIDKR